MKLLKPNFVHNDDKPIFSVDIHPKGDKFATGGQGNDSGRVVIWNLLPVLSEEAELDKKIPKILCQMDNHLSCVNAVRWSGNGLMLASGADDKLVMIWKKSAGSGGGSFGSTGMTKNVENWRCCSTLRGHSGDVLDLAWSPQDRWLATCSVDNNCIVWDAQSFPTIVSILKGHTGLVKGVTWDPVGKFLASQSDDRSLKIWKTSDWSCQNTITEPFEECGGTTHILRLSWSPDGQYLVSAHAMNGGGPTAQIIERDGWKCDKDFVGHRKAVTCVRFHNSILKRLPQNSKTQKSQQCCCLAIGSRDRTLSVWMTALQRPLLVIHDLFDDSILDLSWSNTIWNTTCLLACSGDGTLAALEFTPEQLGTPLSEEDKNSLYQRMYGKDANIDISVQAEKEMIIENADLLTVSKEKVKPPQLFPTNSQSSEASISKPAAPQSMPKVISTTVISSPNKPILKQIETRTSDGKRRITPMFIPLTEDPPANDAFSSSSRGTSQIIIEKVVESSTKNESVEVSPIKSTQSTPTIQKRDTDRMDSRIGKTGAEPPLKSSNIKDVEVLNATQSDSPSRNINKNFQPIIKMNAGKAVPLAQSQCSKSVNEFRTQIYNDHISSAHGKICRILCYNLLLQTDKKIWEIFVGSPVCSFAMCSKFVLLCSLDGTIRILDVKTGLFVFPVLNMTSPTVQSAFSNDCKLGGILTENGLMSIWNMEEESIYLKTSCVDILNGSFANVFYITDHGVPFISTNNGSAYSYSKKIDSWMVVNASDAVTRCGMANSNTTNVKNMKEYPLATIQFISNSFQKKQKAFVEISDSQWEAQSKITFAENQIKLCETVNSTEEVKYWYSMLGFNLAIHGTEKKIRLLLDSLLGPIYSLSSDEVLRKNHKVLMVDKHELLKEVLKHFQNNKWQRLYMEYTDQLDEFNLKQKNNKEKIVMNGHPSSSMDTS